MRRRALVPLSGSFAAGMLAVTLHTACTPLPDLDFEAPDAAPDAAGEQDAAPATEGGPRDGARADADDASALGCPSVAPPGATCCGEKVCVGCLAASCAECSAAGCGAGDVCCLRGANVQCRALGTCK